MLVFKNYCNKELIFVVSIIKFNFLKNYFFIYSENMKVLEIITRAIRWIPSIFVTGVIFWSYYAYVVELCIMTVEVTWERILYMTLYHPLLFMFIWAYWQTVFTEPASPRSGIIIIF